MHNQANSHKIPLSYHTIMGLVCAIIATISLFLALYDMEITALIAVFLGIAGVVYTVLSMTETESDTEKKIAFLGFLLNAIGCILGLLLVYAIFLEYNTLPEIPVQLA